MTCELIFPTLGSSRPDNSCRGGTNLRVGFIELLEPSISLSSSKSRINESPDVSSRVSRHLEKSWPIGEHLKQEKADDLFAWIGQCIAQVVQEGCKTWPREFQDEIPLGIAFSFPMMCAFFPPLSLPTLFTYKIQSRLHVGSKDYVDGKGLRYYRQLELRRATLEGL